MKAVRIIVIGFVVIVTLLALGAAIALANFDAARIKSEATRLVQEKKQRTLKIDGELGLAFWPGLGVRLGATSLSERNSDKIFVALEGAQVSVQLLPLLSKQLVIDGIEVDGLKATLTRDHNGQLNIADLLEPDQEQNASVKLDIAGIRLTKAQLTWHDELPGQTLRDLRLTDANLRTGRIAETAGGKLALSGKLQTGPAPRIDATLKLAGRYDMDLARKRYAAQQLEGAIDGQLGALQGLALTVSADSLAANLAQTGRPDIAVGKLSLQARGKQGGDDFELKLAAPKLQLDADQASGEAMQLQARLAGAQRNIAAQLDLAALSGTRQALRVARLGLTLDAKSGEASLKGRLESPLAADLAALTAELDRIGGELELSHPRMPSRPLHIPLQGRLRVDLARHTASGNVTSQFDDSHVAAQFNVDKFAPLALGFAVDIDKLNADKYLPPDTQGGTADKREGNVKPDFSILKNLDLHGTLKLGQLQAAGVKASNLRLDIKARDGRLDIAPHTANLYEGTLHGALSLNVTAAGNTLAAREQLVGVSINPLLKDALNHDVIEGRGNIGIDVSSRGDSVVAIKQGLQGSAQLDLRDGAIKGINLAQALREAKALISARQDALQQARTGDKTDFSELSASFKIAGGIAHNDDLAAKSPFLRLTGAGDIDIGQGRLDYLARASLVTTADGQGGKELEAVRGITVPVSVSGPFDRLSYKLEFASLVGDAAKARVTEKKQQLEQDLKNKALDQLRGLFRK